MDGDLDRMTRDPLIAEVRTLRTGIREHRDSSEHELCWHHPGLWGLLPEKTDPFLPCRNGPSSFAGASDIGSHSTGNYLPVHARVNRMTSKPSSDHNIAFGS